MATSFLELFRVLASFDPPRVDLSKAPWEAYVDWSIGQGLAPLAAYNLEYRLGPCGAPEWARDRLLALFQGTANDNVMKLVNFKQVVGGLEGRRVVLVGAASFADSLYPHVGFRPVIDLRCFMPSVDLDPFANYLGRGEFERDAAGTDPSRADRILTDHRTTVFLHGALAPRPELDQSLLARGLPMRAYGPSIYRFDLEDALLVQAVLMARAGFGVPLLELVDVRELVLGASAMGGPYSRVLKADDLKARAIAWNAERALWVVLGVVERLFPETAEAVAHLKPSLSFAVRELLDRLIVGPVAEVGRPSVFRGEETVRALLVGG